jgi:hypothetical protein
MAPSERRMCGEARSGASLENGCQSAIYENMQENMKGEHTHSVPCPCDLVEAYTSISITQASLDSECIPICATRYENYKARPHVSALYHLYHMPRLYQACTYLDPISSRRCP